MKFSLLPVGDRFEFKGEAFTKTSPFIAANLNTGAERMFPRSTNVQVPAAREESEPRKDEEVSMDQAVSALKALHQACSGCLDEFATLEGELTGAKLGESRERLSRAYRSALQQLGFQLQ